MKQATICLCVKDGAVLLALKKHSFGAGLWNGFGGKVKTAEGETPRAAAVRELREESSLIVTEKDLAQVGRIEFYFAGAPAFECHVYIARAWQGEPAETDEMATPTWYPIDQLPVDKMWLGDTTWMPVILKGETIKGRLDYNADGSVVDSWKFEPAVFE